MAFTSKYLTMGVGIILGAKNDSPGMDVYSDASRFN